MIYRFSEDKRNLFSQIQEEYGKLVYTWTCHIKKASRLRKLNSRFKSVQIIFSALSTGGIAGESLSCWPYWIYISGVCSILLLISSTYLKDKEIAIEMEEHIQTANSLWLIRERYLSLLTDFSVLTEEEIRLKRNALIEETAEIYSSAPLTDEKSYREAQKALKKGEEQFFTQEEFNKILPQHLRQ